MAEANLKEQLRMRVSNGAQFYIYAEEQLRKLLPLGVQVEAQQIAGKWVLVLTSSQRGFTIYDDKRAGGKVDTVRIQAPVELGLPKFGATQPESVVALDDGSLRVTMPAQLNQPLTRAVAPRKPAAAKAPAAPQTTALAPAPAVPAAAPAAAAPAAPTPANGITVEQFVTALRTVNSMKEQVGDGLLLEVLPDGKLKALVEVGG